jgi:hypothetical protein
MAEARPWYREPWPWLLVAPPAASVVLGAVMWTLAARTHDGLVADDYYKQGLAINQVLDREARARALAIRAVLIFNPERTRVRLQLAGDGPLPGGVTLRLAHPTRAGEDQTVRLVPVAGGLFEGALRPPAAGRWHVLLEDGAATWRSAAAWRTEASSVALDALPGQEGRSGQ